MAIVVLDDICIVADGILVFLLHKEGMCHVRSPHKMLAAESRRLKK